MFTRIIEPESLTRADLDSYLSHGFYRVGCAMITTDFLASDGELRSTIWTRLDLTRHRFRRSLRRRMERNARLFQARVGPLVLDDTREALYARYRERVGGNRASTLEQILGGEAGRKLFETREIGVYRGGELAAFSWFDLGETSVQSLIGVYDPDHRRYGLGFYTLLLEIAYASSIGMRFHYSGYVLSEPSGMDYKRSVGALEYFDPAAKRWLPEPPYAQSESPAEVQRRRLGEAAQALHRSGTGALCVFNSALMFPGLREQVPECATSPILLMCGSTDHPFGILTAWEQDRSRYALFSGRPISVPLEASGEEAVQVNLFIVHQRLGDHASAEEAAFFVRHYLPLIAP